MKTLTPKQRREIYLKAAEHRFGDKDRNRGMCYSIKRAAKRCRLSDRKSSFISYYDYEGKFLPEFKSFEKPTSYWLPLKMQIERVIILLLCAEMTKTAKQ